MNTDILVDQLVISEYLFSLINEEVNMPVSKFILFKSVDYEDDGFTDFYIKVLSGHIFDYEYDSIEEAAIALHDVASSKTTVEIDEDTSYLLSQLDF